MTVVEFVEKETGKPGLSNEVTFDFLELDSLDFLDLIQQFENEFHVKIADEEISKLNKIGDLNAYVPNGNR